MKMEITPFVSIGKLRFGESRAALRALLGPEFKCFKKAPGDKDADAYGALGLQLYYDGDDRLEYVDSFHPAHPVYEGIEMLGRDFDDLRRDLARDGHICTFMDAVSVICEDAGITVYIPEGIVEGVGVYRTGYFDS